MKRTLVTGATGFIGWHVARTLIEKGRTVRALARDLSRLQDLDVEPVQGDLRDPDSLRRAVAGCDAVFHVAADYRLWARDRQELFRSNVEGTENLLKAAKAAGVTRVVYTSTVGCIGVPGDGRTGDETSAVTVADMTGAYKQSKFQAEEVALRFASAGLPVVIVNPTAPVGDRDVKPTPTGRMVLDFIRGQMPAYLDTGLNVVDVRDVAEGHWLAFERGHSGERYILGSENLTLRQIFEKLETVSGVRAPKTRIPYGIALLAGYITTGWAGLTGKEPKAPIDAVRMARKKMWVVHTKAAKELGFQPQGAETALRRAVEWFRTHRYV